MPIPMPIMLFAPFATHVLQTQTGAIIAVVASFMQPMHEFPAPAAPFLLSVNERGGADESKGSGDPNFCGH
jgi:hypothetical protein